MQWRPQWGRSTRRPTSMPADPKRQLKIHVFPEGANTCHKKADFLMTVITYFDIRDNSSKKPSHGRIPGGEGWLYCGRDRIRAFAVFVKGLFFVAPKVRTYRRGGAPLRLEAAVDKGVAGNGCSGRGEGGVPFKALLTESGLTPQIHALVRRTKRSTLHFRFAPNGHGGRPPIKSPQGLPRMACPHGGKGATSGCARAQSRARTIRAACRVRGGTSEAGPWGLAAYSPR